MELLEDLVVVGSGERDLLLRREVVLNLVDL